MPELALPGATIAYRQSGDGPDIIWLAAGDNPGDNWRRYQTPAFEPGYRNTTYDARGAGATRSGSPPPWTIRDHARDLAGLVEAVCQPPVSLVGLSMGSLIAVQLAHDRPDLVRCAVVMGTCVRKTGFMREWEEAEIALRRDRHELPAEFATVHYAMQYYPAEVLGDDELWARIKPFVQADFAQRDGAMLAAQWQACLDFDSSELLPRIHVPIHAVAFSQDVQTPPARVREVADLAADGHFHLLDGLGHGSAFGHRPDAVNACIRAILDTVALAAVRVEQTARRNMATLTAQLVGGPTAILQYAGVRWLTDPALSPPGTYDGGLVKTTAPAVDMNGIEPIDVVLLSHDHHSDNLDPAGREFLPRAGRVLTTVEGARRLGGNALGLEPWSSVDVDRPGGPPVTVTAVPAQHGPDGTDHITGPVIGFLLGGAGLDTVYVSGDNASLDVVRAIAEWADHVDVAVLFAGAVQIPQRFDGAYLTLSSDRAAEAAKILGVRAVVPVHFEGWTHFTQGADALRAAFAGNQLTDRLALAEPGAVVTV